VACTGSIAPADHDRRGGHFYRFVFLPRDIRHSVKNGAAEWVPVTRGPAVGDLVEVYGPLQANDVVLKRGSDEVRQGAKLNVKSPG
jgi:hypothetical protein